MQVNILKNIEKVPGGLMVVPLLFGALLNTIDQMHLSFVMNFLKGSSVHRRSRPGIYEFFRIGGFTEALFKVGTLTLIALFLFLAGSQMNLRVGGIAMKKGIILTTSKYFVGLGVGVIWGKLSGDVYNGFLGLSVMADHRRDDQR